VSARKSGGAALRHRSSSRWVNTTRQKPLAIIIGRWRGKLEKIRGRRDMGRTTQTEKKRRRCPAGLPLALGSSLACHLLLALLGYALLGSKVHMSSDSPLADALLTVPGSKLTLSLDDPPHTSRRKPVDYPMSGREAGFSARVDDLPATGTTLDPTPQQASGAEGVTQRGSGLGPETGTDFFGVAARGHTVVYCIDRSISMGLNGGLGAAKRELLSSLAALPDASRVQVLFYSGSVQALKIHGRTELVSLSSEVRSELTRQVEAIRPEGGTNHLPALRQALALKPDVLFLVTDGDDLTQRDVDNLTRLNSGRTVIHALEWNGGDRPDAALRLLARYNRGAYKNLRSTSTAALP
jgi:hypothetical protein